MPFFDFMVSTSFKRGKDDRLLFFPWGTVGRGLVVPSEREYRKIRRVILANAFVGLPGLLFVWYLLGVAVCLLALLPIAGAYAFSIRAVASNWERSEERLTLAESSENFARSVHPSVLWINALLAVGMILEGFRLLIFEERARPAGLVLIVLFGLFGLQVAHGIRARARASGRPPILPN